MTSQWQRTVAARPTASKVSDGHNKNNGCVGIIALRLHQCLTDGGACRSAAHAGTLAGVAAALQIARTFWSEDWLAHVEVLLFRALVVRCTLLLLLLLVMHADYLAIFGAVLKAVPDFKWGAATNAETDNDGFAIVTVTATGVCSCMLCRPDLQAMPSRLASSADPTSKLCRPDSQALPRRAVHNTACCRLVEHLVCMLFVA